MSSVLKGEHFKRRQEFLREHSPLSGGNSFRMTMTSRCSTLSPRQPLNSEQSGLRGQRCEAVTRSPPVEPAGLDSHYCPLSRDHCRNTHYSSDSCPVVNYSTPLLTSAFQIDVFSTFHDFYCVCWAGWLAASNVDGWCFIPGLPFISVTVVIFVQKKHFLTC